MTQTMKTQNSLGIFVDRIRVGEWCAMVDTVLRKMKEADKAALRHVLQAGRTPASWE